MSIILVVDDNEILLRSIGRAIMRMGRRDVAVVTASGGEDGLAKYAEHEADIALVLTDIMMPGMDGVEMARRISERNPAAKIMFMTGGVDRVDVAATAGRLIEKPFDYDDLERIVSAAS